MRPDEVRDDYIPTTADELDAIGQVTETATNTIMGSKEQDEIVREHIDSQHADQLMEAKRNIYEAWIFQDITGQRIMKVVKTLKDIEEKIDALAMAFGSEIEKAAELNKEILVDGILSDEDLLDGPQHEKEALSQAEIGALLVSFD